MSNNKKVSIEEVKKSIDNNCQGFKYLLDHSNKNIYIETVKQQVELELNQKCKDG